MFPKPLDDEYRLDALNSYAVLDTPPEPAFDRVTRSAASLFDVPIAVVSLVDRDRQWFKSCVGLDASETPRGTAFCAHAIMRDSVMVVPDASADPRFADNPLVTGPPGIKFYAGAPLVTAEGFRLGTLCIIDTKPRTMLSAEQQALKARMDAFESFRAQNRDVAFFTFLNGPLADARLLLAGIEADVRVSRDKLRQLRTSGADHFQHRLAWAHEHLNEDNVDAYGREQSAVASVIKK